MLTIEELRQFRFSGYAIFDLVLSFLGMALIAPLLSYGFRKIGILIPKKNWIILTLPLGIIVHLIFGQRTLMVQNFLDLNGYYVLKLMILVLVALGVRGIRRS